MSPSHRKDSAAVGIAWYRPSQWQRLLDVSADRDKLEDTHAEWLANAVGILRQMRRAGIKAVQVDVDVEELLRWCDAEAKPVDGDSRARFAAKKAMSEHGNRDDRKPGSKP